MATGDELPFPTGRHLLKPSAIDIDESDPRLPPECELDFQADRAEEAYERTHLGWVEP